MARRATGGELCVTFAGAAQHLVGRTAPKPQRLERGGLHGGIVPQHPRRGESLEHYAMLAAAGRRTISW